jgi:hypothetical protein
VQRARHDALFVLMLGDGVAIRTRLFQDLIHFLDTHP